MADTTEIFYELIDLTSGNVIEDYASVEDALQAIRRVANEHGWSSVKTLSLLQIQDDQQVLVAMKTPLVKLAQSRRHTSAVA